LPYGVEVVQHLESFHCVIALVNSDDGLLPNLLGRIQRIFVQSVSQGDALKLMKRFSFSDTFLF
jgi:hypothetical protein